MGWLYVSISLLLSHSAFASRPCESNRVLIAATDEVSFIAAAKLNPRERTTYLVFADFLDEKQMRNAGGYLRIATEWLSIVRNLDGATSKERPHWVARKAVLENLQGALKEAALSEWNQLRPEDSVGLFVKLAQNGLPVFRPRDRDSMLQISPYEYSLVSHLDLSSQGWGEGHALTRLSKRLRSFSKNPFISLDLSSNTLSNRHAVILARENSFVTGIHSLLLTNNHIEDDGIETLAAPNSSIRGIVKIHLGSNPIGDTGAEAIARIDSAFSALEMMNLEDSWLSPFGIAVLKSHRSAIAGIRKLDVDFDDRVYR